MKLDIDPRAAAVLDPVRGLVEGAAAQLPDARLEVTVGPVGGFGERHGGILVLSDLLAGPDVHHPDEAEGPLPRVDRWRRAACTVLEHAALLGIQGSCGMPEPEEPDWRWTGLALYMLDVVCPALQAGHEGLALAIETGAPGIWPRAGVAVMHGLAAFGTDPWPFVMQLLDGGVISAPQWLELGRWVFDPAGAPARLPIPVTRVGEIDIPCALGPWRWAPLCVPAHVRGGRIDVTGPGAVDRPWAPGGSVHRALAGSTDGLVELRPSPGGPVGSWVVTSAEAFGQVMGARGVSFRFEASGRVELTFADAFVGPLASVKMADEVGTSGVASGRWAVADAHRVRFEGIDHTALTVHGRQRGAFRMPAQGFGIAAWLQALEEAPWAWQIKGDRLTLRGEMLGGWVDVRLREGA